MLKAQHLSCEINGSRLLHDITLEFLPGVVYGVVGPNGSGKSTFLKTLSGIWPASSGSVLWNGENLLHKDRKEISRTLTLVPQAPQASFDFTVFDIVKMGRYAHPQTGTSKHLLLDQIKHALRSVDAEHLIDRNINQISSGERQRVYIARGFITESPIILLDEPTANLDIRHQLEIWHLLRKIASTGKTVVVTVHDLHMTERFCDRVAILSEGRCVAQGIIQEILSTDLLMKVFGVHSSKNPTQRQFSLSEA